jgi:hypothetical protein
MSGEPFTLECRWSNSGRLLRAFLRLDRASVAFAESWPPGLEVEMAKLGLVLPIAVAAELLADERDWPWPVESFHRGRRARMQLGTAGRRRKRRMQGSAY